MIPDSILKQTAITMVRPHRPGHHTHFINLSMMITRESVCAATRPLYPDNTVIGKA